MRAPDPNHRVVAAVAAIAATFGCAHDELSTGQWVHDLSIEDNQTFSDADITDRLATRETGWWPFASRRWFDRAAFDLDLQRVKAFYADHGFFDARVTGERVTPAKGKNGGVDVAIVVQESSPTLIGAVTFVGFPPEEEARARKEAASWGVVGGRRFDHGAQTTVRQRLSDRLKEAGYAYGDVRVVAEVDRDQHIANVRYESLPGPRVRLGEVTITGNQRIPAWKLEHRITWKRGDVYDPHALATTQGRLYELGVFSSVRIDLPPEPVETAQVTIAAKPGPLRELRLGGGVGAERAREQVRGRAEWTFSNFLGGLRQLRLRLLPSYVVIPTVTNVQRSGPAVAADARLTQPDLFGTRVTGHALLGYDVGIDEGYQYQGPRAQLGAERPLARDRMLVGASWNLQYLDFFNVDEDVFGGASAKFYGFVDPYRLAYVEAFTQLDLRNRPLDPTFGGYLAVHGETGSPALGSQFHFVKLTPELRLYAPLGRRVVVAARGLVGWLSPYGGDDSPITRRFRLGGPASHRGFGFGRLSPQAVATDGTRIPYGGDGELLFSGDLRIDVVKLGGNYLAAVPFVDAGDVTTTFSALNPARLHVATGLSLEYTTAIGIVRAGVGARLNRLGPGEPDPGQRFAFHITIGEAF